MSIGLFMVSLEEGVSLDTFFTDLLTPVLKKRVALSPEAKGHVVTVLVRHASSHQAPDDTSLDQSVVDTEDYELQKTYLSSQSDPSKLLALADTCLFRQGFLYAYIHDQRRNLRSASAYAHFGSASYARVGKLLLDADLPDAASPFIELASRFDSVTLALTEIQLASLSDHQLSQLYDRMMKVHDARYLRLFEERGLAVVARGFTKETQKTRLYIPPLGSHDNN